MQRRRTGILFIFLICFTTPAWTADVAILRAQIEKVIPKAKGDVGIAI